MVAMRTHADSSKPNMQRLSHDRLRAMIHFSSPDTVRVAVSQRCDHVAARHEYRDSLDVRLVQWLQQAGALAFPTPNKLEPFEGICRWLNGLSPQAVVLSGGNDLGDCPARDATEAALLDYAASEDLPVLGICRGMQMLASREGGTLARISGHIGTVHAIVATQGVELPGRVNSFHSWALVDCPDDYEILAKAPDGTIEAIRHSIRNWEGWMWHPERDTAFDPATLTRARLLLRGDPFQ